MMGAANVRIGLGGNNMFSKGWKVFNRTLQCRDYQYKVGGTYKHLGEIELCKSGFHFHTDPADLFSYYSFDSTNRVCEIAYGKETIHGTDKSVTNEITILRELSWHEVLDIVNKGDWNSGDWNSGDYNSGNKNSGNRNSGDRNSGNGNLGNDNSGNWNPGHFNSGNWNPGHFNSGNWNPGNYNSGYLCTKTPKIRIFDQETDQITIDFPTWFYFKLTIWIESAVMSNEEKQNNPQYEVTGGYLRKLSYKEAWRISWDKASMEDRAKTLTLPNWDNEKFLQISGINVEKELGGTEKYGGT